jgi:putative transposase
MPRPITYNFPKQAHELTFSCFHGYKLLSKDRTRQWLIDSINRSHRRWEFDVWAYVIMPEHVHLLIYPRLEKYSMSVIRKSIKQPVARLAVDYLHANAPNWLERLQVRWPTGRVEYRFWQQGRGYDRNIDNARTAWRSIEYIHNNPVKRGLCASPLDWPWSSAAWYAGQRDVKLNIEGCPLDPSD